jgi:YihY family inner membrane protein
VSLVERVARKVDRTQQGARPLAFAVGVFKKFGDDRGGSLSALLTFYGFLSLFPLLLLLVTILGFIGGSEHSFVRRVENSAFSQFPVVGTKLSTNIHGLQGRSIVGLVVGIVVVLWGSQGALQTAQYAQAEIWNIPGVNRPSFWARLGRTALMMALLGLFLLVSTVLAGLVTIGHHGGLTVFGAVVASLAVNIGLFVVAFRLLTPKQIPWRDMVPGALVGAAGWTLLQYVGGVLIDHSLRNTSKEYGAFAVVLGLIGFLYLAAQVTLYAAEINVVRARHLWPRGLVQPPLTAADREVLSSIALEGKRRPEQFVATGFQAEGTAAEAPTADAIDPTSGLSRRPGSR